MRNNQHPTVLILGASGTIGKQPIKDLEDKEVNVRITSRKQEVVDGLCNEGKDCTFLDLDDPETNNSIYISLHNNSICPAFTFTIV